MKQFIKPDFQNNIINITATLAQVLGCPNGKPTLPALERELEKGYKNVVFLILDGFGMHPMSQNLPESAFLRRNVKQVLTSVFPSTTTNATTTYLTGKYPMEHGWFGWSLYFEELGRSVDIFLDSDSYTWESVGKGFVRSLMPVEPFYAHADSDYTVSVVVPAYWDYGDENRYVWHSFGELLAHIEEVCGKEGRQFIYAYCDDPDSTMHRHGVTSEEARALIGGMNEGLEALQGRLADTLFVISADHGQIDVDGAIEIYRDEEVTELLLWPPYLEARAAAFKVKEGREEEFAALFRKKYGEDFELFKTEDLIAENYFGGRIEKNAARLGDFIAVGKTNKIMHLTPRSHPFKGHHTSLTEEMEVPLIIVGDRS